MPGRRLPLYRYISPTTWPIWIGMGLLRVVCLLPHRAALAVGSGLGRIAFRLAGSRRAIVRRNIELCFPELNATEREDLVKRHFGALGMSVIELGLGRWASEEHLASLATYEGIDYILDAHNAGHGVLLLSAHFTTLEVVGHMLKPLVPPYCGVYRKNRSEFITELLLVGRERAAMGGAIEKNEIKVMVRRLRDGGMVWYAPDQSYNRKGSEVIPFFGIPSMHMTATSTLARLSKAVTIPFFPQRLADGRYHLTILPPLENFPSGDPIADTKAYVSLLEDHIRKCPEQYFWIHRKFKNLPDSYPDYYSDLAESK